MSLFLLLGSGAICTFACLYILQLIKCLIAIHFPKPFEIENQIRIRARGGLVKIKINIKNTPSFLLHDSRETNTS